MKRKIFFLIIILLNYFNSRSQNLFVSAYGFGSNPNKSLVCFDRCFFTCFQNANATVIAMKTDSVGNVLWSNESVFSNTNLFTFNDIVQSVDSGFLILLNTRLTGMTHSNPTVIKLDKSGNYLWTYSYVTLATIFAWSIARNADNGFILAGNHAIKCNANGGIVWHKILAPVTASGDESIASHDFSHFVLAGYQGNNLTFHKTDLSGNFYWHSAITFTNTGLGPFSIKPVSDGGYIATGQVKYIAGHTNDAFLAKIDSAGALLWLKIYSAGLETLGKDVTELSDSSLLMIGFTGSLDGDAMAIKTDKDGNFKFAKTDFLIGYTSYTSVNSYSPGTVLLSCSSFTSFIAVTDTACSSLCDITPLVVQEYTPAFTDSFITYTTANPSITLDSLPLVFSVHPLVKNVLCGFTSENEIALQNESKIYPNPVTDELQVTISNNELSEIILYDTALRKLLQQKFVNSVSLNTSQLVKGVYFYEVRIPGNYHDGVIKKGKVIKE